MRKTIWMVLLASLMAVSQVCAQYSTQPKRKKVAVVLSGGGAKGVAHIGALKVIEEAGIPIDIITGTSMGSIVGGLYSIGYRADVLDSIVRAQDWNTLLLDREDLSLQRIAEREKQNTYMISTGITLKKNKGLSATGGIIKGKNLHGLFERLTSGYNDSIDFNTLPIPFACVATDMVTFTEYDFHSGVLPQAMRASMAIPAVFTPVRIGGMVLVDGGMRNNYPADVAREMGADIIIGIAVPDEDKSAEDLGSTTSILKRIVDYNTKNKYEENVSITDVYIPVNTHNYSAASFNSAAIDTLINRGEKAAREHWDELVALRQRIGNYTPKAQTPVVLLSPDSVEITSVEFVDVSPIDEKYIRAKFHLRAKDRLTSRQAELVTTAMRVDLFYQEPSFHLTKTVEGVKAVFTGGQKKASQLNLGVRFDTEEMVALQVNADIPMRRAAMTDIDLTLRLGMRIMARLDVAFYPGHLMRPTLSYIFHRDEINIYEKGEKDYNFSYNQHAAELAVLNFNVRNFTISGGIRWDYYHFPHVLKGKDSETSKKAFDDDHFFSYYGRLDYNSENDWYFPARGSKLHAQYVYYTDDFAGLKGKAGMHDVSGMWRKSLSLGERFTIQPMFYGRMLFGSERPGILGNMIGGEWFGHKLAWQMPFAGVNYLEHVDPYLVAMQLQAQQRLGKNNYVLLRVAAAQQADDLENLLDRSTLLGTSLSYYYNTMFGPLGASVGYSNKTKEPYFYINLGYVF
ncbi:MAG: patatin-like phospholipase family protein [Bacteroidales bacterium]|nr:patatin-like phospholipase family protein [Bacteroidales bacterium]